MYLILTLTLTLTLTLPSFWDRWGGYGHRTTIAGYYSDLDYIILYLYQMDYTLYKSGRRRVIIVRVVSAKKRASQVNPIPLVCW